MMSSSYYVQCTIMLKTLTLHNSHQRTVQDWVAVDFADNVVEENHQAAALPEAETHPHMGYQGAGRQEAYMIQEEVVMDMNQLQVEAGRQDTTPSEDHLQKQFHYIINSILQIHMYAN